MIRFCFAADHEISLAASINRADIPYEGSVDLTVEIKWIGDISRYSFEILPLPETSNLMVSGTSSSVSSGEENGHEITKRTLTYKLIPTNSGVGIIEPIVLNYVSRPDSIPGALTTQQFKVLIADPIPVKKKDRWSWRWLLWVIIPAIAAAASAIALIFYRRSRRPVESPKSAESIFLENLETIKNEAGGDRRIFFTRLYRSLLEYLEKKHGLSYQSKTADMILSELSAKDMPDNQKEKISGWLQSAQKAKFAPGEGTPGDIIRLTTELEKFFQEIDVSNKLEAR
jgi:hypothetical protein